MGMMQSLSKMRTLQMGKHVERCGVLFFVQGLQSLHVLACIFGGFRVITAQFEHGLGFRD